jgi:hypothetical protein
MGITIGGVPTMTPLPLPAWDTLRHEGLRVMVAQLGGPISSMVVDSAQFVGTALRPDGTPFYLTTAAPDAPQNGPWNGAFFAPFGIGYVCGTVDLTLRGSDAAYLAVSAKLVVGGADHAAANWCVLGPASSNIAINPVAVIDKIDTPLPGPHTAEDIRRCIALHAPQRALGEPQFIVASQCGVAVASLLEAIC